MAPFPIVASAVRWSKRVSAAGTTGAPDDFEARYQLGLVLARMGKPDQALPQLQKAVALKPGDRAAQFQPVSVLRSLRGECRRQRN